MWAPRSGGAMEPGGVTKASTMKARKMKARMKATRMDSMVSLMSEAATWGGGVAVEAVETSGMGVSYAGRGGNSRGGEGGLEVQGKGRGDFKGSIRRSVFSFLVYT